MAASPDPHRPRRSRWNLQRSWFSAPRTSPARRAERNAETILQLFLEASLPSFEGDRRAAALFALGALETAADREGVRSSSRRRLALRLLERLAGPQDVHGRWRRALADFERTPAAWNLRAQGACALEDWLCGTPPQSVRHPAPPRSRGSHSLTPIGR
ncbi:MAG: hypothetical protein AAF430_03235 [Myxococcota bacterium]